MKTFSQIKIGEHLSNKCLDMMVTNISAKFLTGYNLSFFRLNGKIEVVSIHRSQFENRLITANLIVTQPTENIATQEQLNTWCGLKTVDISNIEII